MGVAAAIIVDGLMVQPIKSPVSEKGNSLTVSVWHEVFLPL
jgi:hypothetical protein